MAEAQERREGGREADIGKETWFFGVLGSHTERVVGGLGGGGGGGCRGLE